MKNLILQFYGTDPLVAWALTFALCSVIAAFIVIGRSIYQERQQKKDQTFKATMDRAMEPIEWPRPAGHKTPWKDRRKSA